MSVRGDVLTGAHMPAEPTHQIRIVFDRSVPMAQVSGTFELARLAVESLYGPERLAIEIRAAVNRRRRSVVIGTATSAGRSLGLIFLGFARREFGSDAVRVLRK